MVVVTMHSSLAIILKPTPDGWAVCLTDGRELARFRGPGARWRAQRHLARYAWAGGGASSALGLGQPRRRGDGLGGRR